MEIAARFSSGLRLIANLHYAKLVLIKLHCSNTIKSKTCKSEKCESESSQKPAFLSSVQVWTSFFQATIRYLPTTEYHVYFFYYIIMNNNVLLLEFQWDPILCSNVLSEIH